MASDVESLAAEIQALTPPQRLRLCADLLENRRAETAYLILKRTVTDLGAALAIRDFEQRKAR